MRAGAQATVARRDRRLERPLFFSDRFSPDRAERRGRGRRTAARLLVALSRRAGEQLRRRRPRRAMNGARPPPRPHFFGHERQKRREQPQQHRQRRGQRALADAASSGFAEVAVAARLHQLEIVVAERPEELLGRARARGVVVVLEVRRREVHVRGEPSRASAAIDRLGDRAVGRRSSTSTNFDALSSLIASRRRPSSGRVERRVGPGRPLAAQ